MKLARLAASAAFLMLSAEIAAAKPATVVSEVNLRKGPGTENEVITLIPKGSTVEVGTCTNGWCQVSFNGQDGFSIATNLGLGGPRPIRRPLPPGAEGDDVYPAGPPGVVYAPGPAVVVGPPVYYAPGPYYYGYGPYWRGGWGWRRRW
jgi:Bacterial SH3 domain